MRAFIAVLKHPVPWKVACHLFPCSPPGIAGTVLAAVVCIAPQALAATDSATVNPEVAALFKESCVKCHGEKKAKGKLRLDTGQWLGLRDIGANTPDKLVTYATGDPVGPADHAAVKRILADAKQSAYGLRSIVHALVASELFQQK